MIPVPPTSAPTKGSGAGYSLRIPPGAAGRACPLPVWQAAFKLFKALN